MLLMRQRIRGSAVSAVSRRIFRVEPSSCPTTPRRKLRSGCQMRSLFARRTRAQPGIGLRIRSLGGANGLQELAAAVAWRRAEAHEARGEAACWKFCTRERGGGGRRGAMALACGSLGAGIRGAVSPAHVNAARPGHRGAASWSAVGVSRRALVSASSEVGEEERRRIGGRRMACRAAADSTGVVAPVNPTTVEDEGKEEPKPIVLIDQDSDAEATIVEISFGNRLGALLDTIKALQNLGLNVVRGMISTEGPGLRRKKFLVTRSDNNKKVENPEVLEAIRLTIINNLLQYHPESSEQLAMGVALGGVPPKKQLDVDVATHISVTREGSRSLLSVETADRPGLLLEILQVVRDISVYVESAEIDTEGLVAKDKFYLTYHGEVLSPSMEEVLTNALRYYLRKPETEEDSY